MLYYDRIDISKGIDPTKSNRSKECMICYYWFFNHEFKFQDSVCNGCHDLTILKCVNQEMCNKAVDNYPHALEFVPESYKTQKNV